MVRKDFFFCCSKLTISSFVQMDISVLLTLMFEYNALSVTTNSARRFGISFSFTNFLWLLVSFDHDSHHVWSKIPHHQRNQYKSLLPTMVDIITFHSLKGRTWSPSFHLSAHDVLEKYLIHPCKLLVDSCPYSKKWISDTVHSLVLL